MYCNSLVTQSLFYVLRCGYYSLTHGSRVRYINFFVLYFIFCFLLSAYIIRLFFFTSSVASRFVCLFRVVGRSVVVIVGLLFSLYILTLLLLLFTAANRRVLCAEWTCVSVCANVRLCVRCQIVVDYIGFEWHFQYKYIFIENHVFSIKLYNQKLKKQQNELFK